MTKKTKQGVHHYYLGYILNRLLPIELGRVLDIGCGSAPYFDVYVKRSISTTLCDREKSSTKGDLFVVADASSSLPFNSAEFNTVISTTMIEHLSNPVLFLKECSRITGPDGILLISFPFMYAIHEAPNDFF